MTIKEQARKMKLDSSKMAVQPIAARNRALVAVAKSLLSNKDAIVAANKEDLAAGEAAGLDAPVLKRLKFDENKIQDVIIYVHYYV